MNLVMDLPQAPPEIVQFDELTHETEKSKEPIEFRGEIRSEPLPYLCNSEKEEIKIDREINNLR